MAIDIQDIRRGMEVYSAAGEKIGTVIRVQPPEPTEGTNQPDLDFEEGSLAVPTDMAEGRPVPGPGGQGPIPSGTTRDKGRGTPTAAGGATERGDVHSITGDVPGTAPGSGGEDALRGYGTPADTGGLAQTAGARAADLRATSRAAGQPQPPASSPAPARPGFILVEDQGVLGVGAGGLRVPFNSVVEAIPGQRVVLDCTRAQAAERYGGGPSLKIDPDAPVTPY